MKKDRRSAHGLTVEDDADARYRATFHQAAIGVAHTAPDGSFLDANPALLAMLGYSRREMLKRRLVDLLLRRERRALVGSLHPHDDVQRLLGGDIGAHACIEQYRHRDGNVVWVQRTASLASDADGKPYLIHFIENITERRLSEERQRAAELRYQRTLESALECIVSTDHLGSIVEWNPMAEKVFGYARADVLGRKLSEVLVPPPLRRRHEASMARLVAGDERSMLNRRIETIALKADGGTIPVELMMQRITDTDPPLFTGFLRDISERKEAEARILRLNRLYRILSHTSALIVRAPDAAALFKGICRIARQHGGFVRPWVGLVDAKSGTVKLAARAEDDAEESPRILLDPAHAAGGPVATAIRDARVVVVNHAMHDPLTAPLRERFDKQGIKSLAVLPLKTSGRVAGVFVLKSSVEGYFDEDIQQLLREMSDELTYALDRLHLEQKHREAEQRLAHLAHYDQLTGLPNRGLLYERLLHGIAQAARHGWTLAMLFIDLDRFKTVNDSVGHTLGNELLRQVSARLPECVRAEDTVGRLSGDEFAIVLANLAHAGDAALVATKILARLKQPYVVEGLQVVVSASIGMTLYPQDGADADILMRNADVAMYNAKSRGRDNYQFYTAEMNARARARLELESRLRGALDRDEFLLHYQPKVDIESGTICGFEALLRWQPAGGPLVSPVEFIPLLEETGLIKPVGEWVMRTACGQIAAWSKEGCEPVPVAINLSARQLRHAGFCETAANALREAGVEPRLIEVEITESSLMENPEEAHKTLDELKAVGFTLAIDDFGTGYSSLAYLKRFPFDTLKIDRSFVSDIETNADDATIARTIIALAGSLSLTVVAEGVENEQQLAFLVANRCDQAQGYLFSRPVPADQATAMLKSRAPLHAPVARAARSAIPSVLVVDAERERLVHVQQLLQRGGYQVLTASGLADALDVVANQDVLVAIVDQSIGDARCVEFLRRVAAIDPQVCRIMVGATADPRAVSGATRDGTIHRFLVRGRDDQLLREEVRKMTRKSRQGPAVVRALTRKAVWGLNLRGRRREKSWDAEDPANGKKWKN